MSCHFHSTSKSNSTRLLRRDSGDTKLLMLKLWQPMVLQDATSTTRMCNIFVRISCHVTATLRALSHRSVETVVLPVWPTQVPSEFSRLQVSHLLRMTEFASWRTRCFVALKAKPPSPLFVRTQSGSSDSDMKLCPAGSATMHDDVLALTAPMGQRAPPQIMHFGCERP